MKASHRSISNLTECYFNKILHHHHGLIAQEVLHINWDDQLNEPARNMNVPDNRKIIQIINSFV